MDLKGGVMLVGVPRFLWRERPVVAGKPFCATGPLRTASVWTTSVVVLPHSRAGLLRRAVLCHTTQIRGLDYARLVFEGLRVSSGAV